MKKFLLALSIFLSLTLTKAFPYDLISAQCGSEDRKTALVNYLKTNPDTAHVLFIPCIGDNEKAVYDNYAIPEAKRVYVGRGSKNTADDFCILNQEMITLNAKTDLDFDSKYHVNRSAMWKEKEMPHTQVYFAVVNTPVTWSQQIGEWIAYLREMFMPSQCK